MVAGTRLVTVKGEKRSDFGYISDLCGQELLRNWI